MTSPCVQCGRKGALSDRFCRGCNRFLVTDRPVHLQNIGTSWTAIVVSLWIITYFFGAMVFALCRSDEQSRRNNQRWRATSNVELGEQAAARWRLQHGECPTWQQLVDEKEISTFSSGSYGDKRGPNGEMLDPWGSSYRIECTPLRTRAVSNGPDGRYGTSDDIVGAGVLPSQTISPSRP